MGGAVAGRGADGRGVGHEAREADVERRFGVEQARGGGRAQAVAQVLERGAHALGRARHERERADALTRRSPGAGRIRRRARHRGLGDEDDAPGVGVRHALGEGGDEPRPARGGRFRRDIGDAHLGVGDVVGREHEGEQRRGAVDVGDLGEHRLQGPREQVGRPERPRGRGAARGAAAERAEFGGEEQVGRGWTRLADLDHRRTSGEIAGLDHRRTPGEIASVGHRGAAWPEHHRRWPAERLREGAQEARTGGGALDEHAVEQLRSDGDAEHERVAGRGAGEESGHREGAGLGGRARIGRATAPVSAGMRSPQPEGR